MGWILLIVIVVVVIIFATKNSSNIKTDQISFSNNQSAISQSFVRNSVQFFDGFLSLCGKHQVTGSAYLLYQGTATQEIKFKLECLFFSIDGEDADQFFTTKKYAWENAKAEKDDPIERMHAGEAFMKSLYGLEELHHAYMAIDEYNFEHANVSLSCDTSLFTVDGVKLEANLGSIKQELNKKWPTAIIEIGKGGITIKAS